MLVAAMTASEVARGQASGGEGKSDQPVKKQADDLAKRLILGGSGDADVMSRIVEQMKDVEERLLRRYDPGDETQRIERRIVNELESAIAAAVRRGKWSTGGGEAGDMRRRPKKTPADRAGSAERREAGPADESAEGGGEGTSAPGEAERSAVGPLRELRRGWGHLPARDREEVIQGASEQSLKRYRDWIERYYRALAEGDRE